MRWSWHQPIQPGRLGKAAAERNQYVKLISAAVTVLMVVVPVGGCERDGGAWCAFFANAVLVPTRVPSRAGTPASRTAAADSAAAARSIHNSQAGRSSRRKKFLVMTLAGSGIVSFSGGFRGFRRSR